MEEIEDRLEEARRKAGAEAALLLSGDGRAVLSTLCICLPREEKVPVLLGELLERGELLRTGAWARKLLKRRHAGLQELIRTSVPERDRQRKRFPETAVDLIRVLAEIARRSDLPLLANHLDRHGRDWVPARIPVEARRALVSTAILFFKVKGPVEHEEDGTRVVALDDDVLALTERVNGTVQANVRRDDLIMRQFDARLSSPLQDGRVDFESMAAGLLELAVLGSKSDAGACYLLDPSTNEMELAAAFVPKDLAMDWKFAKRLGEDRDWVATVCAEEGQAIQLPPGIRAQPDLAPTCVKKKGGAAATQELATPMPGPLGSPRPPGVGALVIAKLRPGTESFGAYEMALLRNAALRLALVSASATAQRAAQTFTELSRRAARLRRNSLATDMLLRAERQTFDEATELHKILPDDLAVVLPVIEEVLTTLAEVTRSETATFRAALPDPEATEPHGMTLARVAAYPPELASSTKFAVQPDDGRGVNWQVAKEGRLRYRADLTNEKDDAEGRSEKRQRDTARAGEEGNVEYVRHHPDSASELCVPVFVEDRVVGIVNLESPVVRAYDAQIDVAQALAEHVGTAIANARLVLSGVLQVEASDVLRKGHDLTHAHEPLLSIAAEASPQISEKIRNVAEQIQLDAHDLRTFTVDPRENLLADREHTFPELVDVARDLVDLEFEELDDGGIGSWRLHPSDAAALIVKALTDILDNARRHRSKDEPRILLKLRSGRWGGQNQDILIVESRARTNLRRSRAVNAYRCPLSNIEITYDDEEVPVQLTDEPQLGAYLAGTHARRAGGDVHLAFLTDHKARVVFSVPSPIGGDS